MVTYVAIIKKFHTKTQSVISLLLLCFFSYFFKSIFFLLFRATHTLTHAAHSHTQQAHTDTHTHALPPSRESGRERERRRGRERV